VAEALRAHRAIGRNAARTRVGELLELVGLPESAERANAYPHELSGGMRQRVMLAMALANEPRVLIADEPTTALDVTVQAQILELIDRIKQEFNIGVILITHDLGVVADVAQSVMVMYAGRAVELGSRDQVFDNPQHPYTWGLLESIPQIDQKGTRLVPIEGSPPSLIRVPTGCAFHPRCPHRFEPCDKDVPELVERGGGHPDACHLSPEDKRRLWSERESRRVKAAV
jgi:peptide/nickel transport system ATP-binding protein